MSGASDAHATAQRRLAGADVPAGTPGRAVAVGAVATGGRMVPVSLGRMVALGTVALLAACSSGPEDGSGGANSGASLPDVAAEISRMEAAVDRLSTDGEILANELRYTRGLDRHDEPMIRDVYWPEAAISYGTLRPVSEIGPWANETHSKRAAHQHHVTSLTLDVEGDTAHEEGYILFSADLIRDTRFDTRGAPTPGRLQAGTKASLGTGRYINRYERRNGMWKMSAHEYVHDITVLFQPVDLCATACIGRWDTTDISYLRPLQPLSVEVRRQRAELGKKPHNVQPQ